MPRITFDAIQGGDQNSYTESGYTFTTSPNGAGFNRSIAGLTSNGDGSFSYSSNAIYEDGDTGTSATSIGRVTASDGSGFSVLSVDVDQLRRNSGGVSAIETFTGMRLDGSTVTQTFQLDTTPDSFQTVTLSNFTNLRYFEFNRGSGSPFVQLDNFVITPTPPANNAPCYCTGTRILTVTGEVAVEDLAIGDLVVTAAGQRRPIRWIGTRSYIGRFANANPAVLPVRVGACALAEGVPARDLWVSPDHALLLDGLLMPAELLVNGTTITRASRVESVTYWHVELESHDVLVAEGAPAESFVEDGDRAIFQNADRYHALYPGAVPVAPRYCAPRVADDGLHGHALEALRRRLALRAGLGVAPARVFGALHGRLEICDGRRVAGWAQDAAHPDGPVCLDVVVDGTMVALAYAEGYRADLHAAGIGDGCHAFDLDLLDLDLPAPLDPTIPHTVEVRRSADGASLGLMRIAAAARIDRAA